MQLTLIWIANYVDSGRFRWFWMPIIRDIIINNIVSYRKSSRTSSHSLKPSIQLNVSIRIFSSIELNSSIGLNVRTGLNSSMHIYSWIIEYSFNLASGWILTSKPTLTFESITKYPTQLYSIILNCSIWLNFSIPINSNISFNFALAPVTPVASQLATTIQYFRWINNAFDERLTL